MARLSSYSALFNKDAASSRGGDVQVDSSEPTRAGV